MDPETPNGFELIGELAKNILLKVAKDSAKDACNAACACKVLSETIQKESIMREIDIAPFVAHPNLMYHYPDVYNLAIISDPKALYLAEMRSLILGAQFDVAIQLFNRASEQGLHLGTHMVVMLAVASGYYPKAEKLLDHIDIDMCGGWRERMEYMEDLGDTVGRNVMQIRTEIRHLLFVQYQLLRCAI